MKRVFTVAMLIIGSIVGAGFASGAEIVYFFSGFGDYAWIAILIGAALTGAACVLFLELGRKIAPQDISLLHKACFKKAAVVADAVVIFNCFVVGASMLASLTSTQKIIFPSLNMPLFAFIAAILCLLALKRGISGLVSVNSFLSPLICSCIVATCIIGFMHGGNTTREAFRLSALPMPIIYTAMNIILAGGVMATFKSADIKTSIRAGSLAAAIIGVLMLLIFYCARACGTSAEELPLLAILNSISPYLFYIMLGVTLIAVWTTLLVAIYNIAAWLKPLAGSITYAAMLAILMCFFISFFGFSNIIRYLMPLIGVVGALYTLACAHTFGHLKPLFK